METCDVLMVGGGPAGSTCAWKLRQAGADVLVVDQATFPRDKVCAGWITPPVIETLRLDTAAYASSRTFQPITAFRTGVIGRTGDVPRRATKRPSVTASAAASSTITCSAGRRRACGWGRR